MALVSKHIYIMIKTAFQNKLKMARIFITKIRIAGRKKKLIWSKTSNFTIKKRGKQRR